MSLLKILGEAFLVTALFVLSVRGQDVECRSTCSGTPTVKTVTDCCLNDPQGMRFTIPGGDTCFSCCVLGFFEDSFTAREQGPQYDIQVGYIKSCDDLDRVDIGVKATDITAKQGSAMDYTLNSPMVTIRRNNNASVGITFRVDSIALEPDETFTLELNANVPNNSGTFIMKNMDVTIIDSENVMIQMTQRDYEVPEGNEEREIGVSKNIRIATDLSLRIVPITLSTANATNRVPMGVTIPDDLRGLSPVEADENDYNTSILSVVFMADEDSPENTKTMKIGIEDDAINEALKQVFVVVLEVVSTIDETRVINTRPSALLIITDNDDIRIGFEMSTYTFKEPQFEEFVNVYLAKEDSVESEQTFQVVVRISEEPAPGTTFLPARVNEDYQAQGESVLTFRPNEERVSLGINLLTDKIPEQTESIVLSSSRQSDTPLFTPPLNLFAQTSVIIEDDDVQLIIGFENTSFTVNENVGIQEVCVSVLQPDLTQSIPEGTVLITVVTSEGTAGEDDYTSISGVDVALIFDNSSRRMCFDVTITDDNLRESEESFKIVPSLDFTTLPTTLSPNVTEITIIDSDVVTIGFIETSYISSEGGNVSLLFGVIDGGIPEGLDVSVRLTLNDGTALEGSDYTDVDMVFIFDASMTEVDFPVELVDDEVFEFDEVFSASLSIDVAVDRVTIDPASAQVTVRDDDEVVFGFSPTTYSVKEDVGNVELNVVFQDGTFGDAGVLVTLEVSTADGTATGVGPFADFVQTTKTLNFTVPGETKVALVQINEDTFSEEKETFVGSLTFSGLSVGGVSVADTTRIILQPDTSSVEIQDNDLLKVGWEQTSYPTSEGAQLELCANVISPDRIEVELFSLEVTYVDRTTTITSDYNAMVSVSIGPFGPDNRRACVPTINIIDDDLVENMETFEAVLRAPSNSRSLLELSPDTTMVTVRDNDGIVVRRVNDTVVGDPLMTVPLFRTNTSIIDGLNEDDIVNLCFELHGASDNNFNLVSDQCVSVNAHYTQVRPNEKQNIIDDIYVRAVDNNGVCHNMSVQLDGCSASVDNVDVIRFSQGGVSVRSYRNRVRIAVPNCNDQELVMYVFCENRTLWSSRVDDKGNEITFDAEMIRFVIARGFNLQEMSHGILGQFWNIPVEVSEYDGTADGLPPEPKHYTVTINYPGQRRSFVAMLWPLTWEHRNEYCLYAGDGQAGPLHEIVVGPNDAVVAGHYEDYKTTDNFDTNFEFALFKEEQCVG